ncbi:MAG: alkyl hydroperoxide reductase/Thiol specific antioxidant/Mal allergen [Gemmatimonadetes bacterium]|nr:alkyl hydroperoxide reductase/Thiol specific antioxidant/Mal allergen [Gemmatimonadota bacterium]
MSYPAEGTLAPDFTLLTDAGTPLTLSELRGRPVVLYFYPKDDTAGCTKESCEFRDLLPRFQGVNAQILGISPDDVKSHVKFRDKYQLPFPLLADVGHSVADQYGVWQEKSMYGKTYWGNMRTTFVVGADGRIARVFEKVNPEGHAAEVAEVVAALR